MMSLAFGLAVFLMIAFLTNTYSRAYASDLRRIPNAHFTAPYTRLWLVLLRWQQSENRTRLALHRKLGPVVRIGPRELSIDCIEDGVRTIYGSEFAKDVWYQYAFNTEKMPVMFTMLAKHEHADRKKMLSGMYTKSVIMQSSTFNKNVDIMLSRLQQLMARWVNGDAVDVLAQGKACYMDITTAWLYGTANGTNFLQDSGARDTVFENFTQYFEGFFWQTEFPLMTKAFRTVGFHLVSKNDMSSRQLIERWNDGMVERALESSDDPSSVNVARHFLENLQRANPELPREDAQRTISAELLDHIIASYDVAGITVAYTMYELSKNPEVQDALRTEVRELAQNGGRPLAQHIDDLAMLDAVIMETLRLRPPNPGPWPRVVPRSGCYICGLKIPAGTVVSSTSWTLHHNPDVFPSSEQWLPQRWLHADEVAKTEMKKWFWAFGSGARMCAGSHFAIRVLKAILVMIYTDYETSVAGNGDLSQMDGVVAGPISDHVYLKFRPKARE